MPFRFSLAKLLSNIQNFFFYFNQKVFKVLTYYIISREDGIYLTVKNKVVIISWSQKYNEIKLRKNPGYQMNDISCHILPRKFYGRDTSKVARDLLGKALVT